MIVCLYSQQTGKKDGKYTVKYNQLINAQMIMNTPHTMHSDNDLRRKNIVRNMVKALPATITTNRHQQFNLVPRQYSAAESMNNYSILNVSDGWGALVSLQQGTDSFERFCQRYRDALRNFATPPPADAQTQIFLTKLNKTNNDDYYSYYCGLSDAEKPKDLEILIRSIRQYK